MFTKTVPTRFFAVMLAMLAAQLTGEDDSGLPHKYRKVTSRIFMGAQPGGDSDFHALSKEGIKIVISVDGAKPDLDRSLSEGLRYVHLPIGYSDVPDSVAAALKEVLGESKESVYIHCHHGKHRGPAVAAIAAMIDDSMTNDEAEVLLGVAGTGSEYKGLWEAVRSFRGVPEDAVAAPIVPSASIPDFVSLMVSADSIFAQIGELMDADSDNVTEELFHQTLLLKESFREMARLDEAKDFREWMTASENLVVEFEKAHRNGRQAAMKSFAEIKKDCRACHVKHRN